LSNSKSLGAPEVGCYGYNWSVGRYLDSLGEMSKIDIKNNDKSITSSLSSISFINTKLE